MRTFFLFFALLGPLALATDPPSTHGMALLGSKHVYLSHLPMFHSPHDYQVLLEVKLDGALQTAYEASRAAFPQEALYTIAPERFVLPQMVAHPRPFSATLFRGHFEREGVELVTGTVQILQVLYFKKFEPGAKHPAQLTYFLFGADGEYFGAHLITAPPDFDHLVRFPGAPSQIGVVTFPQFEAEKPLPVKAPGAEEIYLEFGDLS